MDNERDELSMGVLSGNQVLGLDSNPIRIMEKLMRMYLAVALALVSLMLALTAI